MSLRYAAIFLPVQIARIYDVINAVTKSRALKPEMNAH